MAEIVALNGGSVPTGAEPDAEVVAFVEAALVRAKSGETVSIALVEVKAGNTVATGYVNQSTYHHLLSGASRLVHRLAAERDDD